MREHIECSPTTYNIILQYKTVGYPYLSQILHQFCYIYFSAAPKTLNTFLAVNSRFAVATSVRIASSSDIAAV